MFPTARRVPGARLTDEVPRLCHLVALSREVACHGSSRQGRSHDVSRPVPEYVRQSSCVLPSSAVSAAAPAAASFLRTWTSLRPRRPASTGYAKKPGKQERMTQLNAGAVITLVVTANPEGIPADPPPPGSREGPVHLPPVLGTGRPPRQP